MWPEIGFWTNYKFLPRCIARDDTTLRMAAFRTVDFSDRTKVTYLKSSPSSFLPLQVVQSHHGRTKFWRCTTLSTNHNTAQQQSTLESLIENYIPYARHYNPRFVYFLPHFGRPKRFLRSCFHKFLPLCMVSIQERFIIKSRLWWHAYGSPNLKTMFSLLLIFWPHPFNMNANCTLKPFFLDFKTFDQMSKLPP